MTTYRLAWPTGFADYDDEAAAEAAAPSMARVHGRVVVFALEIEETS